MKSPLQIILTISVVCAVSALFFSSQLCPVSSAGEPAAAPAKSRFDPAKTADIPNEAIVPTSSQVSVTRSSDSAAPGLVVTIEPGAEEYPGFHFKPQGSTWDLSDFGHIEARIVNRGEKPVFLSMRVDGRADGGDNTSNTESVGIKPGESGVVKVIFGFAYGHKPSAKPNPAAISNIVIFASKSGVQQSFRVESIEAGGPAGETPPINPENVRIKPENGNILGNGGASLEPKQIEPKEGAQGALEGGAIQMTFPPGNKPSWVTLKPKIGRWDLRDALEVRVKFKNTGTAPVTLQVKVDSNGGPADVGKSASPVAPGAEGEIEIPFTPAVSWVGIKDLLKSNSDGQKGTGTKFTSDAVSGITFSVEPGNEAKCLAVTSITAGKLTQQALPDWLGKRPPVEGDWVKTFDENFNGDTVDMTKWNVYTANFWDKRSHFSKENVIVRDGVAKLHYEKKTGFQNDDPKLKKSDYATGFLDTYGKWVQRYGYFEARMELPTAPGLWPAFWLMPDRGVAAGPQWKRADTGNGGMEFDIMEHLDRWGPYRYNIAWHWDGYGKEHKATGSTTNYFQPDKDGFITAGLLWLPGQAVIYANGREIARWENPRISTIPSDIMFTNVSGGWDNNQIDDSKLSDDFVIDYVRAWQRKDLASDLDGMRQDGNQNPK